MRAVNVGEYGRELLDNVGEVWESSERVVGAHGINMGGVHVCVCIFWLIVREVCESCGRVVGHLASFARAGRERGGKERERRLRERCRRVVG